MNSVQARPELLTLFAGTFGVLVVASIAGVLLRHYVARDEPHRAIDSFRERIGWWWVMVLLLGLAFTLGKVGVVVLFWFVSFLALREFVSLTYTRRGDHWALAAVFFFFLPAQYVLVARGWYGLWAVFIPVYAFLTLPIFAAMSADTTRFFERTAKLYSALMICVYCVSCVPALMMLRIDGFDGGNLLLIAWLVLTVQSSDVLQYLWGELYGRTVLAPALSSTKTAEGVAGGILGATIVGTALAWLTPFTLVQAAGMALVVNLMGLFGSLVLSAIKRDRGVMEWGTSFEGRRGMLERLDSVIFAAPVYYHLIRYGWQA
jgi:phosphatidate cytidylyltransferase